MEWGESEQANLAHNIFKKRFLLKENQFFSVCIMAYWVTNLYHFHATYLGVSFYFIGQHLESHVGKAKLNLGRK